MQTFLPYASFTATAACLDRQRLGKQRIEAWQILRVLTGESSGWASHPAVRMWRGYDDALRLYGWAICCEWRRRGYRDKMLDRFAWPGSSKLCLPPLPFPPLPPWLGDDNFHRAHQSNLSRKLPGHYRGLWPDVPDNLPYIWPQPCMYCSWEGVLVVGKSTLYGWDGTRVLHSEDGFTLCPYCRSGKDHPAVPETAAS